MRKKICCLSVIFVVLLSIIPINTGAISARYMCVMDSITGRILYEKNAHERHGMASTTKIMTAIIALESANAADIAITSYNASITEGSSLYLKAGDKMTVEDLVYGLMLNSGNDAAVVLAEHIAGSAEAFADIMNTKAYEIGAKNTHFTNPNGLSHDDHYTTAYDLALITRHAMKNEQFAKIAGTAAHRVSVLNENRTIVLSNHNKLLRQIEGCDGVKTGFTKATGRCLVSSVTRNGWQAICVTLDAPSDWTDHTQLLNAAFEEYKPKSVISKGQFIRTADVLGGVEDSVRLVADEMLFIPAKDGESFDLDIDYIIPSKFLAPVNSGQNMGEAQISYKGQVVGNVQLAAEYAVEIKPKIIGYGDYLWEIFYELLSVTY